MADRFNCFFTTNEMYHTNVEMLELSYSKLAKSGILVVKTMDLAYGGKQHWVCNYIQNKAKEIGFEMVDIFILVARTKVLTNVNQTQRYARKFHSYFIVFKKK